MSNICIVCILLLFCLLMANPSHSQIAITICLKPQLQCLLLFYKSIIKNKVIITFLKVTKCDLVENIVFFCFFFTLSLLASCDVEIEINIETKIETK